MCDFTDKLHNYSFLLPLFKTEFGGRKGFRNSTSGKKIRDSWGVFLGYFSDLWQMENLLGFPEF